MNTAAAQQSPIRPSDPLRSAVPDELLSRPQWLAWWSVVGEGLRVKLPNGRYSGVIKKQKKPHKLPINPGTGGLASSTRPATWSSVEAAREAAQKWSLTGIGFVFTDSDPYTGVDIDNCRNLETGQITDWAWAIIQALDSYTELSPSGTGVHTIVRGKLPVGKGNQVAYHDGKVELFSQVRYYTVTGIPVGDTPSDHI
jgi:putative DNA primase/helicase